MSVTWGKDDAAYFRELGIDVAEPELKRSGYLVVSAWLFCGLLGGACWYGLVYLAAWALRALGVHVTGI
jgi:hypothetical protein